MQLLTIQNLYIYKKSALSHVPHFWGGKSQDNYTTSEHFSKSNNYIFVLFNRMTQFTLYYIAIVTNPPTPMMLFLFHSRITENLSVTH